MNPSTDESFLEWDRSQKRLAVLEHQLSQLRGVGGDKGPGTSELAAEIGLLKGATQVLYGVALAAHRNALEKGQARRNRPLARARRLG